MRLGFAIFADAAQIGPDGKFTIMGGDVDTVRAPTFPAVHPNLAIVMRVDVSPTETGREHRFRVTIYGPIGRTIVGQLAGSFTPVQPPDFKGGAIRAGFVINVAQLLFETEGTYTFEIKVGEELLGELALHVVRM